ncbi:MAG: hypothetical protein ACYDC1_20855 [Limisphaerales bacterium]
MDCKLCGHTYIAGETLTPSEAQRLAANNARHTAVIAAAERVYEESEAEECSAWRVRQVAYNHLGAALGHPARKPLALSTPIYALTLTIQDTQESFFFEGRTFNQAAAALLDHLDRACGNEDGFGPMLEALAKLATGETEVREWDMSTPEDAFTLTLNKLQK